MTSQALRVSNGLLGTTSATRLAGRIASMDAYRGLVMLLMMGEVLEFSRVSGLAE